METFCIGLAKKQIEFGFLKDFGGFETMKNPFSILCILCKRIHFILLLLLLFAPSALLITDICVLKACHLPKIYFQRVNKTNLCWLLIAYILKCKRSSVNYVSNANMFVCEMWNWDFWFCRNLKYAWIYVHAGYAF